MTHISTSVPKLTKLVWLMIGSDSLLNFALMPSLVQYISEDDFEMSSNTAHPLMDTALSCRENISCT